jgi:hypothetical protein
MICYSFRSPAAMFDTPFDILRQLVFDLGSHTAPLDSSHTFPCFIFSFGAKMTIKKRLIEPVQMPYILIRKRMDERSNGSRTAEAQVNRDEKSVFG